MDEWVESEDLVSTDVESEDLVEDLVDVESDVESVDVDLESVEVESDVVESDVVESDDVEFCEVVLAFILPMASNPISRITRLIIEVMKLIFNFDVSFIFGLY